MIDCGALEISEKLKVYGKRIAIIEASDDILQLLISYRTGDIWTPKINVIEALQVGGSHFVDCINGLEKPLTVGEQGLDIVRILEATNGSMRNCGAPVDLWPAITNN